MKTLGIVLLALVVVAVAVCTVILDEREQVFMTFQGNADSPLVIGGPVVQGPAVVFRIPVLHRLYRFDRRTQIFESPPLSLRTREKQQLEVRYHVLWRVADPRRLVETTPTADLLRAIARSTEGKVRSGLGRYSVSELLSEQRDEIVQGVRDDCSTALRERGLEVVGLGLRELTFPAAALPAIFARMKQERGKVAAEIRAEGDGQARRIRAEAEADSQRTVATARSAAARLRGEGEARSAEIYAKAYDQDEEFYLFLRSLQAYEKSLDPKTTIVLTPTSPFLRYLFSGDAVRPPRGPAKPAAAQQSPANPPAVSAPPSASP